MPAIAEVGARPAAGIAGRWPTAGSGWRWLSQALAAMVLVPLLVIAAAWLSVNAETWAHLLDTTLPRLLGNTAWLVLGVGTGVVLLGVSLAWLVALCEFPGRRWFDWLLMLPFAVPAYVLAFVFVGVMDFGGPVQTTIRALFGLAPNWHLEVRHVGGVIVVMTLVLYPYVYMLSRLAFMGQGQSTFEAARGLGLTPWQAFWRVSLPLARPAIIAGLSLALMETLADFGTVSIFNYDTFTTAIYKAWFGFFDLQSAAQLASLLLGMVLIALSVERHFRARSRIVEGARSGVRRRLQLTGWRAALATGGCLTVVLLAFALPFGQLMLWALGSLEYLDARYWDLLWHTLLLGAAAALATVGGAFVMGYANKHFASRWTRWSVQIGTLGYALPGSVLAVGVMLSLTWLDHRLADGWLWLTGSEPGLLLSGSLLGLLLAYFARFLAVAHGPVDSALQKIRPDILEAARSLGATPVAVARRVYLPMLRPGLLTAGLLVMVDVMKEMPATLLLRPFGWDTLAVRIYELTSEGEWERAALPAISLVLAGLVPVILLVRRSQRL